MQICGHKQIASHILSPTSNAMLHSQGCEWAGLCETQEKSTLLDFVASNFDLNLSSVLSEEVKQRRTQVEEANAASAAQSADWIRQKVDRGEITQELVDQYFSDLQAKTSNLYVHDLNIEEFCPELLNKIQISKYFVDDILPWAHRDVHWPSIFFGSVGSGSGMHLDNLASSFTMTQVIGHKLWLIAPYEHRAKFRKLVPHNTSDPTTITQRPEKPFLQSATQVFVDVFSPNFTQFPLASKAPVAIGVLQPGDTMYLPGRWLHAVKNLDDNVGVARNFISTGNGGLNPFMDLCLEVSEKRSEDIITPGEKKKFFNKLCRLATIMAEHPTKYDVERRTEGIHPKQAGDYNRKRMRQYLLRLEEQEEMLFKKEQEQRKGQSTTLSDLNPPSTSKIPQQRTQKGVSALLEKAAQRHLAHEAEHSETAFKFRNREL